MKTKVIIAGSFVLWTGIILTIFFVVQKPIFLTIVKGLLSLAATIGLWLLLLLASAGTGYGLRRFLPEMESAARLCLLTGLGLGLLGLMGFGLAATGMAHPAVLLFLLSLACITAYWNRSLSLLGNDFRKSAVELKESANLAPAWIKWAAVSSACLSFILALAPPIESFDALLYHLTVPSWWLRDGGLRLVNFFPYWYPALGEGMFVWPLAFHNDIIPQLIHFSFGFLVIILVWDWTKTLWGPEAGWWSIAILLSMPSLTWLAAWAYTDLMLIFFSLASLYSLWKWKASGLNSWLVLCGVTAGFAMGIKYTSVVLPIAIAILIIGWGYKNIRKMLTSMAWVAISSLLMAGPWYLRNLFWTGNPIYPFVFGGPFWDSLRMQIFSSPGTGIGWNPLGLLSLPFVATLGYRDATYFDGRFGPFYLILFPLIVWVLWKSRTDRSERKEALIIASLFSLLNILLWVYGVVQTMNLWQARLLWPGLIPLALPMTAGILEIRKWDTAKLRLSFILSAVMGIAVFSFLLDFGLMVLKRDPLPFGVGIESRQSYASRQQLEYTAALALVVQTPTDAYIYLINEPRSYGIERRVQPDPINDNLPHDFYLYPTSNEIIAAWRSLGYTHVLLSERGLKGIDSELIRRWNDLKNRLIQIDQTEDGSYILLAIPSQ